MKIEVTNTLSRFNKKLVDWKCKRRKNRWSEPRFYGRSFVNWALESENRIFAYTGVTEFGTITQFHGRLVHRWSKSYQKKNYANVKVFADFLPKDYVVRFLTLTVQHPYAYTWSGLTRAVEDLRTVWSRFRVWMWRMMPNARYVRVLEPGGRNGYPHIHMMVAVPKTEEESLLCAHKKWVYYANLAGNAAELAGQANDPVDLAGVRNVAAYVSKYLGKYYWETPERNSEEYWAFWHWMELCYRQRLRTVSFDELTRARIRRKYGMWKVKGVKGEFMLMDPGISPIERPGRYAPLIAACAALGFDPWDGFPYEDNRSARSDTGAGS